MSENKETIILGSGCFWCSEAIFSSLRGVISVEPGYAGGAKENPTYEEVSGGSTGHFETVKVEYDPKLISVRDILEVFFTTHDPTQENGQGNDIGEQYKSVIFYSTGEQKKTAEELMFQLTKQEVFNKPILTMLKPADKFYPAEDYHKNYYQKNSNQAYCQIVINPKLKKLREKFASLLKK
jgi:peptide-methionine (S)-S-oxide reductase